jgi:hypothetical protein
MTYGWAAYRQAEMNGGWRRPAAILQGGVISSTSSELATLPLKAYWGMSEPDDWALEPGDEEKYLSWHGWERHLSPRDK